MQLHPCAADDANAFAEVDLCMARRMGQRHEDLARAAAGDPNVILHYGITAGKTVFEPQPFENPLRGVPLLRRCRLVGLQDRVDDWAGAVALPQYVADYHSILARARPEVS